MKNTIYLLLALTAFLLFTGCETDAAGPKTYDIGDIGPSGVGIVFYITDGGVHGLEVAPTDQGTVEWSPVSDSAIYTTGTAVDTGIDNTLYIIQQAENAGYHVLLDYAAGMATYYKGGGKDDWFLPSINELGLICDNLVDDGEGNNSGTANFGSTTYWSSSEYSPSYAWFMAFTSGSSLGYSNYVGKDQPARVRAVRAF